MPQVPVTADDIYIARQYVAARDAELATPAHERRMRATFGARKVAWAEALADAAAEQIAALDPEAGGAFVFRPRSAVPIEDADPAEVRADDHDGPAVGVEQPRIDSIGTCKRCGYHGPGPAHDCKPKVMEVRAPCRRCGGRGLVDGYEGTWGCPDCGGVGSRVVGAAEVR